MWVKQASVIYILTSYSNAKVGGCNSVLKIKSLKKIYNNYNFFLSNEFSLEITEAKPSFTNLAVYINTYSCIRVAFSAPAESVRKE